MATINQSYTTLKLISITAGALVVGGCSSLQQYNQETTGFDTTGAFQITDRNVVEPVDIGALMLRYAPSPDHLSDVCSALAGHTPEWSKSAASTGGDIDSVQFASLDRDRLDKSTRYFSCRIERATEDQRRQARNGLQERLLIASEQRCSAFKTGLQRSFSRTNFGLGILTTMAGTAGALVNSVSAAKNWAGTAAIASGSRAEYNQDFFANMAAHVVIEGIEKRRRDIYEQIQRSGQAKAYADYPVEAAIKDALFYHGQCSVAAGFQQAAAAIRLSEDPGLNTGLAMVSKLKIANQMMQDASLLPDDLMKRTDALTAQAPKLAGSRLDGRQDSDEQKPWARLEAAIVGISTSVDRMDSAIKQLKSRRPAGAPPESALGLTTAVSAAQNGLPSIDAQNCRKAISALQAAEQDFLAQAASDKDAANRSNLMGDAAKSSKRASLIADQAWTVVTAFQAKTIDAVSAWNKNYDKAIDNKDAQQQAAAITELKTSLTKAPKLVDESGFADLKALCK